MHVSMPKMRTTVEITDEQRVELMRLAAQRGEKGFSSVVREAIDRYLEVEASRDDLVQVARAARGTLNGKDADALANRVAEIRSHWR
jgi:Arc/MetJ-type ribon-helix-helix transcriptional regulator